MRMSVTKKEMVRLLHIFLLFFVSTKLHLLSIQVIVFVTIAVHCTESQG